MPIPTRSLDKIGSRHPGGNQPLLPPYPRHRSRFEVNLGNQHTAPYEEDYVRETVLSLREINPDYVVPLHCTGESFFEMAKAEIPAKLVRAYTGTRLVFA